MSRSLAGRYQDLLAGAWVPTSSLEISHGEGIYLVTPDGKRYMDFACGFGVTNTGHCHPKVVQAVQEQVACLIHVASVGYYETLAAAAERLLSVTPGGLERVFFLNTGSEVVEAAIKLARQITGRPALIAFRGAFHGRTTGATALTTSKAHYRRGHEPFFAGVYHAPYATPFRCPGGGHTPAECAAYCLEQLDLMFEQLVAPDQVAAMFVEPVLGEGGYIDPPPQWLQGLRERCDRYGILLVADEVQSGFGRTGAWWAMEHARVVPDLMLVAKGIASGMPLSALVGRNNLMDAWAPGSHGTTFGGNPVSCAAAVATIDVLKEEGLVENAAERGVQLQAGLRKLQAEHPIIGDVRGRGLMRGVEFVLPGGKQPNPDAVVAMQDRCLSDGVVLSRCGTWNQALRLAPPLIITEAEIDRFLDVFATALDGVYQG